MCSRFFQGVSNVFPRIVPRLVKAFPRHEHDLSFAFLVHLHALAMAWHGFWHNMTWSWDDTICHDMSCHVMSTSFQVMSCQAWHLAPRMFLLHTMSRVYIRSDAFLSSFWYDSACSCQLLWMCANCIQCIALYPSLLLHDLSTHHVRLLYRVCIYAHYVSHIC